ncbi:unnamed protein product [Penicillium glandicola]
MATATIATEMDKLITGIRLLMVGTEMLVFLRDGDLMASPIPQTDGVARIEVRFGDLPDYISSRTFVFEDPKALKEYFGNSASPRVAATKLRIMPLYQFIGRPLSKEVSDKDELSLVPLNNLAKVSLDQNNHPQRQEFITLFENWRAAFRAAPKEHNVQEVIFDLAGGREVNIAYITRLVQLLSTVFALKAVDKCRNRLRNNESHRRKHRVMESTVITVYYGPEDTRQCDVPSGLTLRRCLG